MLMVSYTSIFKFKFNSYTEIFLSTCRLENIVLGIDTSRARKTIYLSRIYTASWKFLDEQEVFLQIILAVGTKLQAIMATMALEIVETHAVVHGMPLVQGSDRYFWFDCPQLLLHLIHFSLFQVITL